MADPITEDWLKAVGFKYHQLDRQPHKHWVLWLGDAVRAIDNSLTDTCDLGVEMTPCWARERPEDKDAFWHCWLRSDACNRYHRFIHLRHIAFQHDVIAIVQALSGQEWNPSNHWYGGVKSPRQAERLRKEMERLDIRMMREGHPWSEVERDPDAGRPLHEHQEFHEKAKKEKA